MPFYRRVLGPTQKMHLSPPLEVALLAAGVDPGGVAARQERWKPLGDGPPVAFGGFKLPCGPNFMRFSFWRGDV